MKRFEEKLLVWAADAELAGERLGWTAAQRGAEIARSLAPVDSGALRGGIAAVDGAVIAAAPHSAMVEYGTSRAAAQPYMLPMAEKMRAEFVQLARAMVKEVLA